MKAFLLIIILSVIALGGWFVFSNNKKEEQQLVDTLPSLNEETKDVDEKNADGATPEENISDEKVENVITYTNQGFSPKTLEIQSGEAVIFKNEGDRGMWVASDVHPTHTIYPGKTDSDCLGSSFDACEGVSAGEEWSFVFTQKGSWKFHNHFQASHGGTIIVK